VAGLDHAAFAERMADGAVVIDGRDRVSVAAGHIQGALNIELGDSFAAYVGWLLPHDARLVLVVPEPAAEVAEAAAEAALQLFRIGYERVEGVLEGGLDAWVGAGRAVRSFPTARVTDVAAELSAGAPLRLLDVRQPVEWRDDGVVAGSETTFQADLAARLPDLAELAGGGVANGLAAADRGEITVYCKSGLRAGMAASILDAAGIPVRLVARGGALQLVGQARTDPAPGDRTGR
jgi:rhodanese-related sulfurtransferase